MSYKHKTIDSYVINSNCYLLIAFQVGLVSTWERYLPEKIEQKCFWLTFKLLQVK